MRNYLILRNATTDLATGIFYFIILLSPIFFLQGCVSSVDKFANKKLIDEQYDALFSCFTLLTTTDCFEDSDCPCSKWYFFFFRF